MLDLNFRNGNTPALNASNLNAIVNAVNANETALSGKADASHTHPYLPLTGGTLTGDLAVQKNVPRLVLASEEKSGVGRARAALAKNASATADNGTQLSDYAWGDGTTANERVTLKLYVNAAVQKALLSLIKYDVGGNGTTYYLYGEHNHPAVADVDGLQTALDGKSDTGHTHDYLPLSGGTLTGDLTLDPTGNSSPVLSLVNVEKSGVGPSRTILRKNASASADYGTQLVDYTWGDGAADTNRNARLVIRSASTSLPGTLTLNVNDGTGGSAAVYQLYGEHNKPSAENIVSGILPVERGGTGNSSGYVTVGHEAGTTLGDAATAEGRVTVASGDTSHAEGMATQATGWGYGAHAEGLSTRATGYFSHAEGINTLASGEEPGVSSIQDLGGSHAEGFGTIASGEQSHAEGKNTRSAGIAAHAEGKGSSAGGEAAHAEGMNTDAVGQASHAEGYRCQAFGTFSHAEGMYTKASGSGQHVFGKYNKSDTTSVEIVGWGTDDAESARKNIRTLDTSGNMTIAGTLTQSSDAKLKVVEGEIPDVSEIHAVRFRWNDVNGQHDDLEHVGYIAQDVEKVAPFMVKKDSNGYKALDYIAFLCAKVEMLERKVKELESKKE